MDQANQQNNQKEKFSKVLPVWKFILLSVITFGLYELFWFYKYWKLLKEEKTLKISPFWRAFFAPLFAGSIAGHLKKYLTDKGVAKEILASCDSTLIGITYFVIFILWKLPDPYWLISFFTFASMLPLVKATNAYWQKEEQNLPSKKFTWWQIILIVLGIILLILSIIVTFMPE